MASDDATPPPVAPDPRQRVRDIIAAAVPPEAPVLPPSSAVQPAKRGRGRPRKHPLSASATAVPNHAVAPAILGTDDLDRPEAEPEDDAGPPGQDAADIDPAAVARCAALDMSDAGNAERLIIHFGRDLLVQKSAEAASAEWLVWDNRVWDRYGGIDAALRVAQRLGARVALEAERLTHTSAETALLRDAAAIRKRDAATWSETERDKVQAAGKVPAALAARQAARRRFATQTRNANRISNMLKLAAPFVLKDADEFDASRLVFATERHTIRFRREVERVRERDLECPDPETERWIERQEVTATVEATPGHDRGDLLTKLVPVTYDPAATCPLWDRFVAEFLPDPDVRRCVQVYSGLGLTAVALQRLAFHYGEGANGKSVFMETLMRVLGPLGVGLPAASLAGDNRAAGQQASPDLVRLIGARIVRVAELPKDAPLKEELVKVLTGGERMPVRNLFKGFVEFTPRFKAHLSGNSKPKIDGTDEGIWRRILLISWPVTVPVERRRELDDVVAEFVAEAPGILNWLIDGVLVYLREGFVVPPAVQEFTQEHRHDQDPVGQFADDCLEKVAGNRVQASVMYDAYTAWSAANAKPAVGQKKFAEHMRRRFQTVKNNVQFYTNCRLHDVPARPMGDTSHAEARG